MSGNGIVRTTRGRTSEGAKRAADSFARRLRPIVTDTRDGGTVTVRGVCAELNRRAIATARRGSGPRRELHACWRGLTHPHRHWSPSLPLRGPRRPPGRQRGRFPSQSHPGNAIGRWRPLSESGTTNPQILWHSPLRSDDAMPTSPAPTILSALALRKATTGASAMRPLPAGYFMRATLQQDRPRFGGERQPGGHRRDRRRDTPGRLAGGQRDRAQRAAVGRGLRAKKKIWSCNTKTSLCGFWYIRPPKGGGYHTQIPSNETGKVGIIPKSGYVPRKVADCLGFAGWV